MKLRDLHASLAYVLPLLITALGAVGWLRSELGSQQQQAAALVREADDLKARIASLELSARNCKP